MVSINFALFFSTDTVVLGGTRQYHSYNTNADKHDSASIWERCCQLQPCLKVGHDKRIFMKVNVKKAALIFKMSFINFNLAGCRNCKRVGRFTTSSRSD